MNDPTEEIRRKLVAIINRYPLTRKELEEKHGKGNVWDTKELQKEFIVVKFMTPFCIVKRKVGDEEGLVEFQHDPRYYYKFKASLIFD